MQFDANTKVRLNDQQCYVVMGPDALQRLTHLSVDCSLDMAEMLIRSCRPHRLRSLEISRPMDNYTRRDDEAAYEWNA